MDRSLDEIIDARPTRGVSQTYAEEKKNKTDDRHSAAVVADEVAATDDQLQREHHVGRSTPETAFERSEHSLIIDGHLLTC